MNANKFLNSAWTAPWSAMINSSSALYASTPAAFSLLSSRSVLTYSNSVLISPQSSNLYISACCVGKKYSPCAVSKRRTHFPFSTRAVKYSLQPPTKSVSGKMRLWELVPEILCGAMDTNRVQAFPPELWTDATLSGGRFHRSMQRLKR